ncbi:hypothetical protein GCM10022243_38630 [Saccharothrix violaceirubra]
MRVAGERRDHLVDVALDQVVGHALEAEPGVQVDQVHPQLAHPQPRHAVREQRPQAGGDLGLPRRRGQVGGGHEEPATRRVEVGAHELRRPARALLDVGLPVGRARVHRVLDPGLRPREQVDQGVGVAGQVAHDVAPGPARQQARAAQRALVEPLDDLVQDLPGPPHLGDPGHRVLRRGGLLAWRGYRGSGGSDLCGIGRTHGHPIPGLCAEWPITPA